VLEQRRVVHVPHVVVGEPQPAGQAGGENAAAHRLVGLLAGAEIGDEREAGEKVGEAKLRHAVTPG
jgi:hypothetical protein